MFIRRFDFTTISDKLHRSGYAHIRPEFYYSPTAHESNLCLLQKTYPTLVRDNGTGNRFRAYSAFDWIPDEGKFTQRKSTDYYQDPAYNYIDGGRVRVFEPIANDYLENGLLREMLEKDIEIARQSGIITFDDSLEMGLHQIRYSAKDGVPAYSSPLWLHRDDEPLVFVHLFNLTENSLGGDNLIATDLKTITNLIRLTSPLETILLTKKPYHAVTPLGSADENPAYRDILLVTFMNK